jgi:DNA-binding MarR family transcriptional regulator
MTDQPAATQAVAPTVARALDLWNNRLGRQFGPLSRPQRRALRTLHELSVAAPPVRVSDLADRLGVTSAGATRMLSKLEDFGYISRFREPEADQREVYVMLTGAGSAALQAANDVYFDRVDRELQRLTEHEQQTLARLLAKLTNAVDEH